VPSGALGLGVAVVAAPILSFFWYHDTAVVIPASLGAELKSLVGRLNLVVRGAATPEDCPDMAEYTFGVVQVAAEEVRTDKSYFFDNQHRPDGSGLVLQLTIEGAAFLP